MIHLYYGFGKGKTTSAFGLAARMAGHGHPVLFCQFLKDGTSGEILTGRRLDGITVLHPDPYLSVEANRDLMRRMTALLEAPHHFSMLVLDEALDAVAGGAFSFRELETFMDRCRHSGPELVITGHHRPPRSIRSRADYITLFQKQAHPFDQGTAAREGIEY